MTLSRLTAYALCVTCLLGASPAFAQEDWLGRLFFSPEDRERLNVLRERGGREELVLPLQEEEVAPPLVPDDVIVNGVVLRKSTDHHTVWVNGQAIRRWESKRLEAQGLRVDVNNLKGLEVQVEVLGASTPALLKPGYRQNTTNGNISDGYQSVRIATSVAAMSCDELKQKRWERRNQHGVCVK